MERLDRITSSRPTVPRRSAAGARLRSRAILLMVLLLSVSIFGCTGDSAQQLFENAQLEERQNNQAHAKQLYQEIVIKYPKSEYARKAEARLRGFEPKK
jgi:hypothetical protein